MMLEVNMVVGTFFNASTFIFSFVQSYEMILSRDSSFDNLLPSHTLYYMDRFEGISRPQCALQCVMKKSQCTAILYNGHLQSCTLMKCHLTERLVDFGLITAGSEFWFQNDVCPLNWTPFVNHCYFFNKTTVTWNEAKVQCEKHGARLIEIDTHVENLWAAETFLPPWDAVECSVWSECCTSWIGATDRDREGVFTWNLHINITYSNWYPGQPDNVNQGDCVSFCRNGYWDDNRCNKEKTFICETD